MNPSGPSRTELTAAQKKKLLIAQGAIYRLGLCESKNAVRKNLHVEALVKSTFNSIVASAANALGPGFSLRNPGAINLEVVLPLLISGMSLFAKRKALMKPASIGVIVLAAGLLAGVAIRKNQKKTGPSANGRFVIF